MKTKHLLLSSLKTTGAFGLATVMSLGFTACTDKDDATAQNPLSDKITGTFYQLYQATGTVDHVIDKTDILSETEVSRDYTRVVEVEVRSVQSGSLARPKWKFGPSKVGVWTVLSGTARPCLISGTPVLNIKHARAEYQARPCCT